ncbi:MAG: dTDP-4-dehydrorhamnose 3,5-epimerase, partial [Dethiobacter sp.]
INEFFLGDYNPLLIRIPQLVLHGFKALGSREALLLNCPSEPYNHENPDEYRVPPDSGNIPYSWQ